MKSNKNYLNQVKKEVIDIYQKTTYCQQYYDYFLTRDVGSCQIASDIGDIKWMIKSLLCTLDNYIDKQEESDERS